MENININIVPDVELLTKAQIKLSEQGIDLKTAFDSFLRNIIEVKGENISISPNTDGNTNIERLLECAGMFDDESTKEILSAIEDCKKIELEAWDEVFD